MSLAEINIVKPGPCLLLQDLGRIGSQAQGFSPGGAVDEHAFLWANRLLGNNVNSPCLEITLGPCVLYFHNTTNICITGAADTISLNGKRVFAWHAIEVPAKSELRIELPYTGLRSYLAISGGFKCDNDSKQNPSQGFQCNSASMVMREGSGPFQGKALKEGAKLWGADSTPAPAQQWIARKFIPEYRNKLSCKISKVFDPSAPQDYFNALLETPFSVHSDSSRMAVKLTEGIPLKEENTARYSQGTCFGAIQLPPDGKPIILLKDRQTIGGYPHIATLDPRDAFLLSQARPGTEIRFAATTFEEQHRRLNTFYTFFGV